jgi:O-antigen/teichoic acid export membrane protein
MPMLLLGVLSTAWMPRIFAIDGAEARAAVLVASRDAVYRLLVPVVIGLSVGSPLVLRLWAPPEYRPDELVFVTCVVIISAIPYAAGLTLRRGLLAEGRTGMIAGATAMAAMVNIVLNLVLVPRYELVGSAIATFLAYGVLHGVVVVWGRRVLSLGRGRLRGPLTITAAGGVALLSAAVPATPVYLGLRAALAVLSFMWFIRILVQLSGDHDIVRAPTRT